MLLYILQVVFWVELSIQRRLCPIFVKLWVPIKGIQQCGIGLPNIHKSSTRLTVDQLTPGFWGVTTPPIEDTFVGPQMFECR